MRYGDLIQFEPLESVVQLRWADERGGAQRLVETFIVSAAMADQVINVVIPQLRFDQAHDSKGILVVGNYGTGKSHLLSVLSAIAEYPELANSLRHAGLRSAAEHIQGRFKVLRLEIGAVTGSLRDMVLRELSDALARWGTPYTFPSADQITNNKDSLIGAMAAFQARYPRTGVLLLVDELLEHLERRQDHELILDLGFLRELGEVAALTPLRCVAGVQATLFDHPRFRFAAERVHRVRERFEQVTIARDDLEFVVANRLLSKTDAQLTWITDHLRRDAPLYGDMPEHIDQFARLFPIHPAYLATFENVRVAEKRMVLTSISNAIRDLLPQPVPNDGPGLVSYDHYWTEIASDASLRHLDQVREVVDKSEALAGRIKAGYTRKALLPLAERIIHALSVQRLTTADSNDVQGATAEELKNGLCLFVPTPVASADFLLGQVQVALDHIMRTVSGQYIAYNAANGQYCLDTKKDIDFDALIQARAAVMGPAELNRYFYAALRHILNQPDTTHNIWPYQLPWRSHNVTRPGYLCFSEPNLRPTAQAERDFYLYFCPPFHGQGEAASVECEAGPDDVLFCFKGDDGPAEFTSLVRTYAGARAQADSPTYREVYLHKADEALRRLVRWLCEDLRSQLQVIYGGVCEPVDAVVQRMRGHPVDLDELVRVVGAYYLTPRFEERYPNYPAFTRLSAAVTEESRATLAGEAIRFLGGRGSTALATGVLDGLGLLDEHGAVRPDRSAYARDFLAVLTRKPEGEVVNRTEVLHSTQPIEKDALYRLDPEWVIVVLLALVSSGDIVLDVDGNVTLDALTIDRAVTLPLKVLTAFRHFARPRTLPLEAWVAVFEGLGVQSGLMRDETSRRLGPELLQQKVRIELDRVASLEARLQQEPSLWNAPLFTGPTGTLHATELRRPLRRYKQFLDELSRVDTEAKLRNLKMSTTQVDVALEARTTADRAAALLDLVAELQPLTTYLAVAEGNLESTAAWSQLAGQAQSRLLDDLRRIGKGARGRTPAELRAGLETLKRDYIRLYSAEHRRLALGPESDDRRKRLADDARLPTLKALSSIELLGGSELETWQVQLAQLRTCREYDARAIADTPTCPYCGLRPAQLAATADAEGVLDLLDAQLDTRLRQWRAGLRTYLTMDTARQNIAALTAAERGPIELFLDQGDDAATLPSGFVDGAVRALRGIRAVRLQRGALLEALENGGLPCTGDELQARLATFVARSLNGHSAASTRLTLSDSGPV